VRSSRDQNRIICNCKRIRDLGGRGEAVNSEKEVKKLVLSIFYN